MSHLDQFSLVPRPVSLTPYPGEFPLSEATAIRCAGEAGPIAALWREYLSTATGFRFPENADAAVRFVVDESAKLPEEAYHLTVRPEQVLAVATSRAGLVNALQTLRQLLPVDVYRPGPLRGRRWALPCADIVDRPRFVWRGALLDVARHFMPLSFLLRVVDLLALHKLNLLHLHLTDDQGWRFPSSAYPRLVERGSWRTETLIGHHGNIASGNAVFDGTPHGGYYTKDELSSLVGYAAARNVTVMPEIDLPGHVQAVVASYPELGCALEPVEVRTTWGISPHVLNLSKTAMRFCTEVIGELLDVFPSPFVHVGGDECSRDEWRSSPQVQERIFELGLSGEDQLQAWFTGRLGEVLRSAGRRLVGWDEILESGQAPAGSVVMAWRNINWAARAVQAGLDAVVCPESPCYFNHYQSEDRHEPLATHGLNTLEDVYNFDPLPPRLASASTGRVLGTELLLWTPYIPTERDVEYMAFPRGAALAEVAWSEGERGFEEFHRRLQVHLGRLDSLSVGYRPLAGPLPWQQGGTGGRRAYYGTAGKPVPLAPWPM